MARRKLYGENRYFRPELEDEADFDALPGTSSEKVRAIVHWYLVNRRKGL